MKKRLFLHFGIVVFAALLLINCKNPVGPPTPAAPPAMPAATPAAGPKSISSEKIIITAPVKGATPSTTAIDSEKGDNFTIGTVTWSPAVNSFVASTVYTASVTLTAKSGYTFNGLGSTTVNGQSVKASDNTGSAVTLSHTFPATSEKTVTNIAINTQPTKLGYTHGDKLDLAGLVVTLTHDDKTTEDVAIAKFADKNITANPSAGNDLVYSAHNGQPVKITYGSLTSNTGNLTVNRATPKAADYDISGTGTFTYDGNAKKVTVTAKSGKSTGAITVKYNSSTTAPLAAGTDFNLVSGLSAGTLKIIVPPIEMVYVPGGSFQMGPPDGDRDYHPNQKPVHKVTLTGFFMGKYEVTQSQYQAFMGTNPSYFNSNPANGEVQGNRPVEWVSWYNAIVFCNRLSIAEGLSPAYRISESTNPSNWGAVPTNSSSTWNSVEIIADSNGYRLPTEAQWEYAARGGNGSLGNYIYSGSNTLEEVAWYENNSDSKTHEVGKKKPNGLGLYDMSGNVAEWCWDWWGDYSSEA